MFVPVRQVFLARDPVDMRCGHYGLHARVRGLGFDVFLGDAFVFFNRKRDRVKILLWSPGGLLLIYKRLEKSSFFAVAFDELERTRAITGTQLGLLLDGADPFTIHQKPLWRPDSA